MKKHNDNSIKRSTAAKLRSDDHELWDRVARTVKPLRPVSLVNALPAFAKPAVPKVDLQMPVRAKPTGHAASKPAKVTWSLPVSTAPANSLDRRQKQKLARGNVDIDARIDLHGQSVEQAGVSLRAFLRRAREHGHRNVLVITGKGASPFTRHTLHSTDIYHAPERQGRLRVELPRWLQERDMAEHVIGFQPAHPRHGGGGAFYIRLRRKAGRP